MHDNNEQIAEITKHMEHIMDILDIPLSESTKGTPQRVAKMWVNEFFRNVNNSNIEELVAKMKLFPNTNKTSNLIIIKDMEFHSTCEHHLLPFSGKVNIAYAPKDSIIGLSKPARVVKFFSQQPQLQERLTNEIGGFLTHTIEPLFLLVEITATHGCVQCRGVESNCETNTIYTYLDPKISQDFLHQSEIESKYTAEYYNRR